jgi:hypothetical protein
VGGLSGDESEAKLNVMCMSNVISLYQLSGCATFSRKSSHFTSITFGESRKTSLRVYAPVEALQTEERDPKNSMGKSTEWRENMIKSLSGELSVNGSSLSRGHASVAILLLPSPPLTSTLLTNICDSQMLRREREEKNKILILHCLSHSRETENASEQFVPRRFNNRSSPFPL